MVQSLRTGEETRGLILEQFWDELSKMDRTDVARRSSAVLSGDNLYLSLIGEPVEISCRDKTITKSEDKSPVSREEIFVTLKYLLGVKDLPLTGTWVNPLEFIGGDLYFRSHKFKLAPLEEKFSRDPEGFLAAGKKLGGSPQKMGDAALTITALPRLPVTFVLWCADDEFPASVKVLFDATAEKHVTLGVLLGLVNLAAKRLVDK